MSYDVYGKEPRFTAFIDEINEVCKRHGMSISHQDTQGAFIVEDFSESNVEWLRNAHDERAPTADTTPTG